MADPIPVPTNEKDKAKEPTIVWLLNPHNRKVSVTKEHAEALLKSKTERFLPTTPPESKGKK